MFNYDWFSCNIPNWSSWLAPYKNKPINFLELGCFEGRATLWLLENILTQEDSTITCVDTFAGSGEHYNLDLKKLKSTFYKNVLQHISKMNIVNDTTHNALCHLHLSDRKYDCIYIDACHAAIDVLRDGVMSWGLLKSGGIIIFDDYIWSIDLPEFEKPKLAIDAFLTVFANQYTLIEKNWQVALIKK